MSWRYLAVVLPIVAAHPLDVHLQAAYLAPAPHTIGLELDISPGVLVAHDALADLDPSGDRRITDQEARACSERVLGRLQLHAIAPHSDQCRHTAQPDHSSRVRHDLPPRRSLGPAT